MPAAVGDARITVIVLGLDPGTTLAGEKFAVAPTGSPVSDSVTALVKGLVESTDPSCTV